MVTGITATLFIDNLREVLRCQAELVGVKLDIAFPRKVLFYGLNETFIDILVPGKFAVLALYVFYLLDQGRYQKKRDAFD